MNKERKLYVKTSNCYVEYVMGYDAINKTLYSVNNFYNKR